MFGKIIRFLFVKITTKFITSVYVTTTTLPVVPDDLNKPSYTKQRVGINSIKQFLPSMCDACRLG